MKQILYTLSLLPGVALISSCGNATSKETRNHKQQKPNIIYIFADDLGIGDLSCYGATQISTPNIDRLAGQGVQFTNAYATSATSTPSRFGLLTGMYPWRQENTGRADYRYSLCHYGRYDERCRLYYRSSRQMASRFRA